MGDLQASSTRRRRCGGVQLGHECPNGRNDCCANHESGVVCGGVGTKPTLYKPDSYVCCNSWQVESGSPGITWCANPTGGKCAVPEECQSCPCKRGILGG